MILNEELLRIYRANNKIMKPETVQALREFTHQLKTAGIEGSALKAGEKAPGFRLVNAMGFMVSLEECLSEGPVVVSFYRGSWCPYCNEEIKAFQEYLPRIRNLGANLIAISPELPDNSLSLVEKMNLQFEVLSDRHNRVAKRYGLVFKLSNEITKIYIENFELDLTRINGDESWELPIPATFIIDHCGTIVDVFADIDYTKRMEPDRIIEVLTRLREEPEA